MESRFSSAVETALAYLCVDKSALGVGGNDGFPLSFYLCMCVLLFIGFLNSSHKLGIKQVINVSPVAHVTHKQKASSSFGKPWVDSERFGSCHEDG